MVGDEKPKAGGVVGNMEMPVMAFLAAEMDGQAVAAG